MVANENKLLENFKLKLGQSIFWTFEAKNHK